MSLSSAAIIRFIVPVIKRMRPFPHICASYVTSVAEDFGVRRKLRSPFIALDSTCRPSFDGGWNVETRSVDSIARFPAWRALCHDVPGGTGRGGADAMPGVARP